ncbi:phospholipase [Halorientalis sp. IM1011]|uniref:alpha/beta hydrolase n=1 Tax=Halorientalis sp. IM1011 TaxID=1932360 RepID=UPI00097CCE8F|nr:phospholipase [Halorientalis sp. IM1011]AQL42079.1 phospholipase [Halorientalis sp. IM1011]
MGEDADSATPTEPHAGQPIETAGAPPQAAEVAVVLLHGRGSSAQYMLRLIDEFLHHGVMYLAPKAAHSSWYPYLGASFEKNEPWLSSAFDRIRSAMEIAGNAGIPPERTLLLGFSQGGSVVSEFVVRNPRRYGGLVVLSGRLLEPEPDREPDGNLDGTQVFFGCSADDPYVTVDQVRTSARIFEQINGDVENRLYDDLGHEINDDEIRMINSFIEELL